MNICIISKYPPIEGGVSSITYWLTRALGELGHKVYIVTNCWEVEKEWREEINKNDLEFFEPHNVKVFSTKSDFLFARIAPVPKSKYYIATLTNLAVDTIRRYNIDVIYSYYLLPYGICGLLAKEITKKPLVIRHAGTDIALLYKENLLHTIFTEVLKGADKIRASPKVRELLGRGIIKPNKLFSQSDSINIKEFHPKVTPFDLSGYFKKNLKNIPIFSFFGKLIKTRRVTEFAKAAAKIKNVKFKLLFVAGKGERARDFENYISSLGLKNRSIFLPFQAPWKIPSLMNASNCIVCPESYDTPFLPKGTHVPRLIREAMACGRCTVVGEGMARKDIYRKLQDGINTFIVDPLDTDKFAEILKRIIENPNLVNRIGKNARKFSERVEDFDSYIQSTSKIFKSLAK